MQLTIEIDCGNAAFENDPNYEICRILYRCVDEVRKANLSVSNADEQPVYYKLRDVNGNAVGRLVVSR